MTGRKVNYFAGINGNDAYVTVTVTFRGKSHTESLPCYDFKGRAVQIPDAMLVNKTIKRCYVKAAAMLTGLGIGLYINGSTTGDGQNDQHQSTRTTRRTQNRTSSYRNTTKTNRKSNLPSDKQINFLKGLLKQAKSDGTKGYVYLYSHRDDLQHALSGSMASRAIKYLQRLIKYQKQHTAA